MSPYGIQLVVGYIFYTKESAGKYEKILQGIIWNICLSMHRWSIWIIFTCNITLLRIIRKLLVVLVLIKLLIIMEICWVATMRRITKIMKIVWGVMMTTTIKTGIIIFQHGHNYCLLLPVWHLIIYFVPT